MPELAELHDGSHLVSEFTASRRFSSLSVPAGTVPRAGGGGGSVSVEELVRVVNAWQHGFTISSRARGKEVCTVLT